MSSIQTWLRIQRCPIDKQRNRFGLKSNIQHQYAHTVSPPARISYLAKQNEEPIQKPIRLDLVEKNNLKIGIFLYSVLFSPFWKWLNSSETYACDLLLIG